MNHSSQFPQDGFAPPPPPLQPASGWPSSNRPKRKWIKPAVIVASALLVAGAITAFVLLLTGETAIEKAYAACDGPQAVDIVYPTEEADTLAADGLLAELVEDELSDRLRVQDNGKSLTIQTLANEDDPLGLSVIALECALVSLQAPDWVADSVMSTRALDGRRDLDWDGYIAEFAYHPDDGLNMLIRVE